MPDLGRVQTDTRGRQVQWQQEAFGAFFPFRVNRLWWIAALISGARRSGDLLVNELADPLFDSPKRCA